MLRETTIFDLIAASDTGAIINLIKKEPETINSFDSSGRTPIHAVLDKLTDIDASKTPADALAQISLLRYFINQDNVNIAAVNKDNKSLAQLFSHAVYGSSFESYRDLVGIIIKKDPNAIKDLFFNAIYANNLDMVKHLLQIDENLIHAVDGRGFSAYQVSLSASSVDVENFFYANYGKEIYRERSLNIDLSRPQTPTAILKAAITYENPGSSAEVGRIIDELYNNPDFRPTMEIVAASLLEQRGPTSKPIRIFFSDSDNVKSLTPKSKGHGDYDDKANILRLGAKRDRLEIKGTLIHELTHLAAQLTYNNETKPYAPGTRQEAVYKQAISELETTYITRENLHDDEIRVSKLLVTRIEGYRVAEGRHGLPSGTLTEPEYIVSIPQGMVQLAAYHDDARTPSIVSRGMPMYQYWRDVYNADAVDAFKHHQSSDLVDTRVPFYPEVQLRKIILTTSVQQAMHVLMGTRFDTGQVTPDTRYPSNEQQFTRQYRLTNQLIMGKILSDTLSDIPAEISLTQANNLVLDPVFNSKEFKDANLAVFKKLTEIWERRGRKPADGLTLEDLSRTELKSIQEEIPKSLTKKIEAVAKEWDMDAISRYTALSKAVEQCLKEYSSNKSISSSELKTLGEEITNRLYANLPLDVDPKALNLSAVLPKILVEHGIVKVDTSTKKTLLSVSLEPAKMKVAIQDIAASPDLYTPNKVAEVRRGTSSHIFQVLGISKETPKVILAPPNLPDTTAISLPSENQSKTLGTTPTPTIPERDKGKDKERKVDLRK